jgi:hypothetical protein
MFATLVKELGESIGLRDLSTDVSGALTLTVDGFPFLLQYYDAGQELYIIHRIGTLPEYSEQQIAVQRFLLEKNCFFREVGPGVLGVEKNDIFYTVRVGCCDKFGQRMSGEELEHMLRAVVDTCAVLRSGCAEVMHMKQDSALPAGDEFLSMIRV